MSHVFRPADYGNQELDMRDSDSILAYVEYLMVHTSMPTGPQLQRMELLRETAAKVAKEEGKRESLLDGAHPRPVLVSDASDAINRLRADRAAQREANK